MKITNASFIDGNIARGVLAYSVNAYFNNTVSATVENLQTLYAWCNDHRNPLQVSTMPYS